MITVSCEMVSMLGVSALMVEGGGGGEFMFHQVRVIG